jgi:tetratricopeptide (TPR) repeat protein
MGLFGPSYHKLCEKGIAALEAGDLETASELFMKAMRKDPSQPRAFFWLGATYQQAASEFGLQGNQSEAEEYGELSVKAFDEAIQRETDPELKAMAWRQRGITLGGLGRTADRDASWHEADKVIPGFTSKAQKELLDNWEDASKDAPG